MKPERWSQIDALFERALEIPAGDRGAFLELACRGDGALRNAVERLLAADERARTFLELPASLQNEETAVAGTHLGPYRIDRLLSHGGMGTVYLATRDDGQFERQVALKLLQAPLGGIGGIDDPEALQRFRAERQVLARLEHPAIARLYDGGETAGGIPFLVMEYVEGLPLDLYCDRNRLGIDDRLRLFLRLLDAVAYAHSNLLVHRDVKPANILVTAQGEPKLLDFGIAKQLAGQPSGEPTSFRLMTPAYASPEQVRGESITTASDVYSLGVVLYELLCGRSPYRLGSAGPHELETAILHRQPEKPSQALDGPGLEEIGAARRARPGELRRKLRGDLDTLALAALRKEPHRRYRSVDELAADVERYLGAFPISARRETALYSAGKLARRHPIGTALAGLALTLIAALFAGVLDQRDRAERERDKARLAMAFLVDVFEQADPYQRGGEKVSARELLETGARRASRDLAGDPEVQATLLDALGRAALGLGHTDQAEPLLRRALALRRKTARGSLELADSLESVAWLDFLRGDYPAAETLYREALGLRRRLAPGAPSSTRIAANLNHLGTVLVERSQSTGAERSREIESLHREALAIYRETEGPDGKGVADSLFQLGRVLQNRGELAEAERLLREVLRIDLALLGETHPETSHCRRALAQVLIARGGLPEAERLLRQALAAQREVLPADHPDIAWTKNDLALVRFRSGDAVEAELLFREVLATASAGLGQSHAHTLLVLHNLASALVEQRKFAEAARLHEKALAGRLALYGERHVYVAFSLAGLARALSGLGRHGKAIDRARRSLAISRGLLQPGHPDSVPALRAMGIVLLNAGRPAEARPFLREALAILRRTQAPRGYQVVQAENLLKEARR